MTTMELSLNNDVHVLTLTNNEGENMLNASVLDEYLSALDQVEAYQGNTALLITCEHEKTFSTGIDLSWLVKEDEAGRAAFVLKLETLLYRIAMLNAPSIVCINGNAYAGGAIISAAADFRIMRADRGRFCLPEVNLAMPFPGVMNDIINLIPNKYALKQMALTGVAYTGIECKQFDLVDDIYPLEELQTKAFEFAATMAQKDRANYTVIKRALRPDVARHEARLLAS